MYLLDSNVISGLRKAKPHGAVLAWINSVDDEDLFIPAVVFGEVQAGVELTRRQDPTKAQQIEGWLDQLDGTYQIVAMDGRDSASGRG